MFEKIKDFKNKFSEFIKPRIKFINFKQKDKKETKAADNEKKLNMQKVKETRALNICSSFDCNRV